MGARRWVWLVVVGAALAGPAGAVGAVRLGPDVTIPPPSGGAHLGAIGCQQLLAYNPCSHMMVESTNPQVVVKSPVKGIVTSWSFRAGCCTDPQTEAHHITLGTFRPDGFGAGGYYYATARRTGDSFELPAGSAIVADTPTTLNARVPIEVGEVIGAIADYPIGFTMNDTIPGVTYMTLSNNFTYSNAYGGAVIYLSALVEPDADADGYGDETQDCKPADASAHGACPPPPAPIVDLPSAGINCYPNCPPIPGGGGGGGGGGAVVPIIAPQAPTAGAIPPPSSPNAVYVSLTCPPGLTQPCGGYLILVPGGSKKAAATRTRYVIASGATKRVKIPLTAKLRKQLKRAGRVKVTLRLQPDGGKATAFTRTIKLAKPKAEHQR